MLLSKGQVWKFYKTDDWMTLRAEVLRDHHFECAECLKVGRYTRADCVHHVNEVRHRPDLALSRYYIDREGQQQANLVPLCNQCHNMVHDKLGDWRNRYKYTNEERW
jgi:5-methylcytosine-specific restriction endonuclease McrA